MQAATGLGQLHQKGYLHGDISPYNIAVDLAEDDTTTTTITDLATLCRLTDSQVCTYPAFRLSVSMAVAMGRMLKPW